MHPRPFLGARNDHEMVPSRWASSRMGAISADSLMSISLDKSSESSFPEPERERHLEVASAVWFLVPGRCTI